MSSLDLNKLTYKPHGDYVLIDSEDWVEDTSQLIQIYKKNSVAKARNNIAKVLKHSYNRELFKHHNIVEGDYIFIGKNAIGKKHELIPQRQFSNIHTSQIQGVFRNNELTIEALEMLDDKVLMEKVDDLSIGIIELSKPDEITIGKVIKCGKGGFTNKWQRREQEINVGDVVLFWNNITTNLMLKNKKYLCTEDSFIIGKFINKGNVSGNSFITLENLELLKNRLFITEVPKESKKILGSFLYAPEDDGDDDYASIKDNEYMILKSSNEDFKENDKIIISRTFLEYVDFKGKRYYTCKAEDVEAIIYDN